MKEETQLNELMRMANAGDAVAYEQLFLRILPMLRTFVSKRLHRFADGEDVVQEILISVHKARHTFDSNRALIPWLMAIARYRLSDYCRRNRKISRLEIIDNDLLGTATVDMSCTQDGEHKVLKQALSALNGRQREIITLLKMEGLSTTQAAIRLGMSISALKTTAHRAYRLLKKSLEENTHADH